MTQNDTLAQRVAAEVRAEMARQGKRNRELAPVLDVSEQAVSERMRGSLEFRLSELYAVARFLGVPISRFIPAEPADAA